MAKILFTGVTQKDTATTTRPSINMWHPSSAFQNLLQSDGHETLRHPVKIGEPLDVDIFVMNMTSIVSFSAPFALNAMWGLYTAIKQDVPIVLAADDWQVRQVRSAARTFAKLGHKQLLKAVKGVYIYRDVEKALQFEDQIIQAADWLHREDSPVWERCAVMFLAYRNWGDWEILSQYIPNPSRGVVVDPTPLFLQFADPDLPMLENRERSWCAVSLAFHRKWEETTGFTWPIDHFGPRIIHAPRLKTEQDVFQAYRERWGATSSKYYHDGAGLARLRFYLSAAARAVMFCGPKDAAALGSAYQTPLQEIENASDYHLAEIAQAQRDTLLPILVRDVDETRSDLKRAFAMAGATL